jgi:hypothetical protein
VMVSIVNTNPSSVIQGSRWRFRGSSHRTDFPGMYADYVVLASASSRDWDSQEVLLEPPGIPYHRNATGLS